MDHREHGQGDDGGPFDSDCICRQTKLQQDCAAAGCGFCIAAKNTCHTCGGYRFICDDGGKNLMPCDVPCPDCAQDE